MSTPDVNIMNAVLVLRATTREVHAMLGELERILATDDRKLPVAFLPNGGRRSWDDYASDEHNTVVDAWRRTFPAQERRQGPGRRRPAGELTVLVDIGQIGGPAAHLGTPCVLVAWTTADDTWIETIDAGTHWPPTTAEYTLVAERLLLWTKPAEGRRRAVPVTLPLGQSAWFFLVPLTSLTSPQRLAEVVMRPACDLIAGKPAEQALGTVREILRLAWDADGAVRSAPDPT